MNGAEITSILTEEEWLKREEAAEKRWQDLQEKLRVSRDERQKQNERIRLEWEAEKKRLEKQLEEEEEKKRKAIEQQKETKRLLDDYVENGGSVPEQLLVSFESNPSKPSCPFFVKTGACRYGNACSRNHIRPGVSKVVLVPNFYSHYSLEHAGDSEYGNDLSLEFDRDEMYQHFREFFYDVLPEMEKCGRVRQFKVCCNQEGHLRGNVYVEYDDFREAIRSLRMFQGRWYSGKQLNVEFCRIDSWKSAICGNNFFSRISTKFVLYDFE